jgi:hypothetical protein
MSELTLSKQTLIKLLERASSDPCEPYGCDPWEPPNEPRDPPELRSVSPLDWVGLNPQPLPPKGHWRPANVARITIARALALHETAEALAHDGGERAVGMIQRNVNGLVEDWCGTGAHPRPFPWPWGPILRGTEELQPIELIVAGAQFQKVADALEGSALQGTFEGAADRLLKTGLSRLKFEGHPPRSRDPTAV